MSINFPSTVLVTGATSGVGFSTCIEIAPKVSKLIVVGRNQNRMKILRNKLKKFTCTVEYYLFDFLIDENFNSFLDHINNSALSIEAVVHAIGGKYKTLGLNKWKDYEEAMLLNLGFSHEINMILIPKMILRSYGKIVHVGSLVSKSGNGMAPYVVSKSAIEAYVASISREVAKMCTSININCVAPGPLEVEYKGLAKLKAENPAELNSWLNLHGVVANRLGKTSEIATAINFLLSEGSNFMHGSVLRIDGGGF